MLRLIKCEFWKLKRKKFVLFVIFAALLFPIPFTALIINGGIGNMDAFEGLYEMLISMGEPVMLPCILGIIAAMLFFMERDNGTLKNLRAVPVPSWKIATAKIAVLFVLGFLYSTMTVVSAMIGGVITGGVITDVAGKLGIAALTGILYTAAILPVVIAIIFFNRYYIFSIILTFFYTMFNFSLMYVGLGSKEPVMKALISIMPTPVIYRWQESLFVTKDLSFYSIVEPYFLSLPLVITVIGIIGSLSYLAIIKIYRGQES